MKIKTRFITSIFIVLTTVLAVVSKLLPHNIGTWVFDIFIIGVTMVAALEISNLMEKTNRKVNKIFTTFYIVVYYCLLLIWQNKLDLASMLLVQVAGLIVYFVLSLIIEVLLNKKETFKNNLKVAFNTIISCVYPSFFFALILSINHFDFLPHFSLMFITLIFAITWLTDTFAYLIGCTVKGPKLAPSISPNKTISGSIGGLIGGIGGAMLVFMVMSLVPAFQTILSTLSLSWWHFLIIGFVGSIFGQAGDLFESKLKRNANIKDTGSIFPGHGGMLDRIDAMIFVTIVVYLAIVLIIL